MNEENATTDDKEYSEPVELRRKFIPYEKPDQHAPAPTPSNETTRQRPPRLERKFRSAGSALALTAAR